MFRQILKNSIQTVIEHQPDDTETKAFVDYIDGVFHDMEAEGKHMKMTDLVKALFDCCKNCFVQCEECGEYFLPTQEYWNSYTHCCRKCKPYADPDMMPGGHDYY